MSDIVERLRAHLDDDHQKGCEGRQYYCECGYDKEGDKLHAEAADEIKQVRAERDNWEAVCSGSLKEQFRLARENEARLKLALEQLDKAATEVERLQGVEELYKSGTKYWNPVYQEVLTERDTLRAENAHLRAANEGLGKWMSVALDDPNVCAEMKADISAWFDSWLPRLRDHPQARKE